MRPAVLVVSCALVFVRGAFAQFTPLLLQNDSYWTGGKAEYDFFDAQLIRDGQPRPCEVIHTLVRDSPAPNLAAIRFNQVMHAPAGLVLHQQMLSSFFKIDNGMLLNASLTHADGVGNTFKELTRLDEKISFTFRTYENGITNGSQNIAAPANAYFYDELPLRVRLIDFSKPKGEFEIQLAPSIISAKKDTIEFKSAKVSFAASERKIDISISHVGGTDQFVLDPQFPFLLREWHAADGSHLKMKNSLRVDYLNFTKNGDRERALKDPMLRHPD